MRREEAKQAIDTEALELIEELDDYAKKIKSSSMSECKKVTYSSEIENQIKSLEEEIPAWEEELKTFKRNVKRWIEIQKEAIKKYQLLRIEMDRVKPSLFSDDFECIAKKQKNFCKTDETEPIL